MCLFPFIYGNIPKNSIGMSYISKITIQTVNNKYAQFASKKHFV